MPASPRPPWHSLHPRSAVTGLAVTALGAILSAPTALAHVSAEAETPEQGAHSVITFRVPTESDSARTVGLDVALPTGAPLASVQVEPVPGWDAEIIRDGENSSPTRIVWTATDGGAGPDEFVRFPVSAGPLPEQDSLALPAVQHYSDGSDVEWTQQVATGADGEESAEPDRPAPVIALSPASDSGAGEQQSTAAESSGDSPGPLPWIAVGLAATALLLAAAAVAVAVVTVRRPGR